MPNHFCVAYWLITLTFRDMLFLAFVRQNAAVTQVAPRVATETQWFEATTKARDPLK